MSGRADRGHAYRAGCRDRDRAASGWRLRRRRRHARRAEARARPPRGRPQRSSLAAAREASRSLCLPVFARRGQRSRSRTAPPQRRPRRLSCRNRPRDCAPAKRLPARLGVVDPSACGALPAARASGRAAGVRAAAETETGRRDGGGAPRVGPRHLDLIGARYSSASAAWLPWSAQTGPIGSPCRGSDQSELERSRRPSTSAGGAVTGPTPTDHERWCDQLGVMAVRGNTRFGPSFRGRFGALIASRG